jgi:hypothetical protein
MWQHASDVTGMLRGTMPRGSLVTKTFECSSSTPPRYTTPSPCEERVAFGYVPWLPSRHPDDVLQCLGIVHPRCLHFLRHPPTRSRCALVTITSSPAETFEFLKPGAAVGGHLQGCGSADAADDAGGKDEGATRRQSCSGPAHGTAGSVYDTGSEDAGGSGCPGTTATASATTASASRTTAPEQRWTL